MTAWAIMFIGLIFFERKYSKYLTDNKANSAASLLISISLVLLVVFSIKELFK